MYHGLRLDVDGKAVEIPGQDIIPQQARVRAYPAVTRHSWIWVWMGDPSRADESLIPPAVGLDDPEYILGFGHLDYAAEARLINDNLLDFSHLSFVHAASFGAGPEAATTQPRITTLARGVRVERWTPGTLGGTAVNAETPMDQWLSYEYLVPGVLLMWIGMFPAGTAEACAYEKPDYDKACGGVSFSSQAVTPTDEKTARYFFSWGPHRDHGDESLRDQMSAISAVAFAEDKRMIEAQQRIIDRTPDPQVIPSAHDRGLTIFNRLVEKLAREDGVARAAA